MTTKVYAIKGCTTAVYRFTLGKAQPFKAEFSGGIPDAPVRPAPATFVTSSLGQQLAIESSPLFKARKIFIISSSTDEAEPVNEAPAVDEIVESEESLDAVEFPEVTTFSDAVKILKAKGAKATDLRSRPGVQRAAESLGLSFPNYNFD